MGVTGALLAFPDAARRLTATENLSVTPTGASRPPSELIAAAQAAAPGERVTRLRFPASPREALLIDTTGHLVALDPYTAAPLRVVPADRDFVAVVTKLHTRFAAGTVGGWATAAAAIALAFLSASGLWLWRPRGRPRRRDLLPDLHAGRPRTIFELHRIGGFYLSAVLLVGGLTGAALAFDHALAAAVSGTTGEPPQRVASVAEPISPEAAVAAARRRSPGQTLRRLYLPGSATGVYKVFSGAAGRDDAAERDAADAASGHRSGAARRRPADARRRRPAAALGQAAALRHVRRPGHASPVDGRRPARPARPRRHGPTDVARPPTTETDGAALMRDSRDAAAGTGHRPIRRRNCVKPDAAPID